MPIKLITLIASHVGSERRRKLLNRAIESALDETNEVWVSVSWEGDHDIGIDRALDPRVKPFRRVFGRCSQAVHWMILGYSLRNVSDDNKDVGVVLLDDDDVFLKGAGQTLRAQYTRDHIVSCGGTEYEVSGTVMSMTTFIDWLSAYADGGGDPTYPMSDVSMFETPFAMRKRRKCDIIVVDKTPFCSDDSTWFKVAERYGPRLNSSKQPC